MAIRERGWTPEVVGEYASGRTMRGRNRLQYALQMLEVGAAGALVVTRWDRLARSTSDALHMIELAQKQHWTLVVLQGGMDTSKPGQPSPPLRELGFAPTLLAAHARHSDLLQVADIVVGTVRDFTARCVAGANPMGGLPAEGWREENLRRIGPRFRRGPTRVIGYGFDVFPLDGLGVGDASLLRAWAFRGTSES